ncbi:MAG TPA: energy transducer TonB [Candidatus Dormibacteraeota bacterium]|jgi:TonB family protein|nr:energy transducer TonB [Candidatus Dormibacteraeota bacterium]
MTTMIADPPTKQTRLGVGFDANRKAPQNREAWKQAIGTKPISARLAMLPEPKRNWSRLGVSAGIQIAGVIFLIMIPLFYPEKIKTVLHFTPIELAQPRTEIPVAKPPAPPKIRKTVTPPPAPVVEPVKLNPQQVHVFLQPKAVQPKAQPVEVKAPVMTQVFDAPKVETKTNEPKRPKEDIKVGNLNTGNATPATVKAPVEQVQTGGFGDPSGLKGKGDPNKGNIVVRQGLPTLPGGPGYGNGTGGDKGIRGTVASTGFGNGTAVPPSGGGKKGNIQSTGFGDATVAAEAPKKKAANDGPADTPVTILDKPKPEYTAEGRSLKLEGDVVLDVVFLASGKIVINRVISGLGHGLDENASRAASQIHFKPALREGQPVDYPARVRIEFRLAY